MQLTYKISYLESRKMNLQIQHWNKYCILGFLQTGYELKNLLYDYLFTSHVKICPKCRQSDTGCWVTHVFASDHNSVIEKANVPIKCYDCLTHNDVNWNPIWHLIKLSNAKDKYSWVSLQMFLCVKWEWILNTFHSERMEKTGHGINGGAVMDGWRGTDEDMVMFEASRWPHIQYKASFFTVVVINKKAYIPSNLLSQNDNSTHHSVCSWHFPLLKILHPCDTHLFLEL